MSLAVNPRYLTKPLVMVAPECPTKVFHTSKRQEVSCAKQEEVFLLESAACVSSAEALTDDVAVVDRTQVRFLT